MADGPKEKLHLTLSDRMAERLPKERKLNINRTLWSCGLIQQEFDFRQPYGLSARVKLEAVFLSAIWRFLSVLGPTAAVTTK